MTSRAAAGQRRNNPGGQVTQDPDHVALQPGRGVQEPRGDGGAGLGPGHAQGHRQGGHRGPGPGAVRVIMGWGDTLKIISHLGVQHEPEPGAPQAAALQLRHGPEAGLGRGLGVLAPASACRHQGRHRQPALLRLLQLEVTGLILSFFDL